MSVLLLHSHYRVEPSTHIQTHTCTQAGFIRKRRAKGDKRKNKVYFKEATKREGELEAENDRERVYVFRVVKDFKLLSITSAVSCQVNKRLSQTACVCVWRGMFV